MAYAGKSTFADDLNREYAIGNIVTFEIPGHKTVHIRLLLTLNAEARPVPDNVIVTVSWVLERPRRDKIFPTSKWRGSTEFYEYVVKDAMKDLLRSLWMNETMY